ncbi:MAG: hypothetical protein PHU12_01535 [Candidatus Aenigmarchaeota archaeon]|nr:hypothetical protein [Candidatus Aenigmarchaeota archaeon]
MSCTGFANYKNLREVKSAIEIICQTLSKSGETAARELYTEYLRTHPDLPKFEDMLEVYNPRASWYQWDEQFAESTAACVLDQRLESIDMYNMGDDEKYEMKRRAIESSSVSEETKKSFIRDLMDKQFSS